MFRTETYTGEVKIGRFLLLAPVFGFLLPALTGLAPVPAAAQALERQMYVSVLDERGTAVVELGPSDVEVREDNVVREVLRVAPATAPMQIAVLVDNSQAASPFVRDLRSALPVFFDVLLSDADVRHQVALIAVAERPTILTDYTADRPALTKGIDRLFVLSATGSYLLDGLIEVSRGIRKREPERPVIVVITTEGPEMSSRHYQTVLEPLRASRALLHVVGLGPPTSASQDRAIVLTQGSRDSGGRYDTLLTGSALASRLKALAVELTRQHLVTYARPRTLIPPEKVSIRATRPKHVARGRPVEIPSGASPVVDRDRGNP